MDVAAADAHDAPASAMMLQATVGSGLWRLVAAADALDAADAHHAPGHRGFWAWRLVAAADAHDAPAADAHDAPGYGGFWAVEGCGSG